MASFPQPAIDPATDPARPHISKEALPHIVDFLRDEKPSVRHRAVLGLLAQSQLPDGPTLLLTIWSTDQKKRVVGELCRLVGDLHDIAPDVLSTLINLSGTDMGLDQMLASPRLTDALMENLSSKNVNYKKLSLMLLSNLTRSFQGASLFMSSDTSRKDLEGYNVLRLISWFLKYPAKISSENPVVDEKEEMSSAIQKVLDDEMIGSGGGSGGSGGGRHQERENTVQHAHDAACNA